MVHTYNRFKSDEMLNVTCENAITGDKLSEILLQVSEVQYKRLIGIT